MLKIEKGTRNRIIPKWNFHKYLVCQHVFTLVAFLPAFRADIFFVKITQTCGQQFATAGLFLLKVVCPRL